MNYRWFVLGSVASLSLFGDDQPQETPVPPEVIQGQLEEAEREFREAKEMFNPWYAGPLITPSAHIIPPGMANIQPYLFWTNTFAKYDESGHSHHIPNIHTLNPQFVAQIGIISWMDAVVAVQGVWNKQKGHSAFNWGDSSASLGFGLLDEGSYNPALLIGVKETFPTGKYQHLDPDKNGIDATGAGAYQTTVSFNISKVVWWALTHPMNLRLSLNYGIPAMVNVHGFNAYGGVSGTRGKVRLGNSFQGDLGYEFSFTQRWVLALDVVYTYEAKTTFSGHAGVDELGTPAVVGAPFNDQLSFAPALEYNPNPNLGILAGVWFTAWGRNSSDFVSGVVSVTYTF